MLVIVLIIWGVDSFVLTPKESKIIKKAARKKRPVIAAAFDNRQCELKVAKELGDEGYIRTEDGWMGFLGRGIAEGNPKPDKETEEASPLITRVFMLPHAKVPFLVGYAGKAILTNPHALAVMEHAQKKRHKIKLPFEIRGKQLLANVFWPVNLTAIKKVFSKSWNQSQLRALEKSSELTGMFKGKKYFGQEGWRTTIMAVSIILALGIILVLVMVLAPRVL